jgi:hypothetical protein
LIPSATDNKNQVDVLMLQININSYNKNYIKGLSFKFLILKYMDNKQKDSPAWIIQTWASFVLAISMTTIGVVNLPVNSWVKGFVGMGMAFSVGSSFTLAKTMRDLYETRRLTARIDEAKVERLLSQHDPYDPLK